MNWLFRYRSKGGPYPYFFRFLTVLAGFFSIAFALPARAGQEFGVSYSAFFAVPGRHQGWSALLRDQEILFAQGNYPSALRISLYGQPEGSTGTVIYQVNSSGQGWLPPVENWTETGLADLGQMPIESVRVWLNGSLAQEYDVYAKAWQQGEWTPWAKNGEDAGTAGVGTHIEGLVLSLRRKEEGPPPDPAAPRVRRIDPARPMVALTYDDGPNGRATERILNVLDAVEGKATFFVVGNRIGGFNAALLRRMADSGHEIGNHTYDHTFVTKLSDARIRENVGKTSQLIHGSSGMPAALFRPPGGATNRASLATLGSMQLPVILWSVDTLDWKTKTPEATVSAVLDHVRDGDIVLMHDLHDRTATASQVIIPELVRRGYQLVTVSELAQARGVSMQPGTVYFSFR